MKLRSAKFSACPNSAGQCLLILLCFPIFAISTIASDSTGVKRIHKDIGPLKLPPSAFTASSVYKNQPDYQAHKANLVVFASQEQTSGAWCPARPVQNQLNEWLQIDFDALKIMRVLFTEGRGNSQNSYVPAFLLRYQRQEGHRWYDYRMRNGTKLLYANHNSQTIAITLDPPIVARRFRLYPYHELEPRFMCLRIAVYGTPFEDGVIEYTIPEGSVYRMDPRHPVSLNDTDYDGSWTALPLAESRTAATTDQATERKAYFYGGLGLLMDKNYYDGQLPELGDNHNVVGWFRRQHATPLDRVVLVFTFDQVRNFTRLLIHAMNSLDYVAVFRRVSVQFSLGGQYYDRLSEPVVLDVARDAQNRQARWIRVPLGYRLGRFVRVTLWFDYDWIVLSEIAFESSVAHTNALPAEESTDPARRPTDLELDDSGTVAGSWLLPRAAATNNINNNHTQDSQPESDYHRVSGAASRLQPATGMKSELYGDADLKPDEDAAPDSPGRSRLNHMQYLIAILCCCLGSIVLVTLLVFAVYRSRQNRRRRRKKLKSVATADTKLHQQQHQQLLLANTQQSIFAPNNNNNSADILLPDSHFQTMLPNSFQYNQLKSQPTGQFPQGTVLKNSMDGGGGAFTVINSPDSGFSVSLLAPRTPGSVTYPHTAQETITTMAFNHFSPELDHDGLLTMQLMQHGANVNTNFSPLGGGATVSRRGGPDIVPCFASYPFSSINANSMANFSYSPSGVVATNTGAAKLNFCPPPPPNQPLPPLPPPSTSPDSASLLQSFTDGSLVIPGTVSHVNPYAASCPMNGNAPDANMILPFDGSMPEYASASLFSGNGSNQPVSWGNASFAGPAMNVKACAIDPETGKYKNISDTYCVPHQNSMHQPYTLWSTNQPYFQTSHGLHTTVPNAFATIQRTVSDARTGSFDSGGMYYLANACGGDGISQTDANGLLVSDCYHQPQSTIFIPYPVGSRPMHGAVVSDQFSHDRQKPIEGANDTTDSNLMTDAFVDKYHGVCAGASHSAHSCAAVNGTDDGDSEADSNPEIPVWPSVCRNHSPTRFGPT